MTILNDEFHPSVSCLTATILSIQIANLETDRLFPMFVSRGGTDRTRKMRPTRILGMAHERWNAAFSAMVMRLAEEL
jgi:hypothetical protein